MLAETWAHESGAELRISAACLDTGGEGGRTQAAYDYARERLGRKVFAVKGVGGWGRPIVTQPSKIRQRGLRPVWLHSIGVDEAKVVVAQLARIPAPGPGHCHFPVDRDPAWYDMFTAETLRTKYLKGFPMREWQKVRPRNEAFDCRVYAYAALSILRPNIKRLVSALEVPKDDDQDLDQAPQGEAVENLPEDTTPPNSDSGQKRRRRKRRKSRRRQPFE